MESTGLAIGIIAGILSISYYVIYLWPRIQRVIRKWLHGTSVLGETKKMHQNVRIKPSFTPTRSQTAVSDIDKTNAYHETFDAVTLWSEALSSTDYYVRLEAINELVKLQAIPSMIMALDSIHYEIRLTAVKGLAHLGVTEGLVKALHSNDHEVRMIAAKTLRK